MNDLVGAMEGLPRVRGERVRWASGLGLDAELARLLAVGSVFDGLSGLKSLQGLALEQHILDVCRAFSLVLPRLLRGGLERLAAAGGGSSAVQRHINSKFVMDAAFVGRWVH